MCQYDRIIDISFGGVEENILKSIFRGSDIPILNSLDLPATQYAVLIDQPSVLVAESDPQSGLVIHVPPLDGVR